MIDDAAPLTGPDLILGVPDADLPEGGTLLGHAGGEAVLLVRAGGEVFAISPSCTHYSGPLAEGLVVGETIRCPWHHACFSLRSGEAVRAPAFRPLERWRVERREGRLLVADKQPVPAPRAARRPPGVDSIVILGAGAAGSAAAEMLRREGYDGKLTLIDADPAGPVDRPNLSKDYLSGAAPEAWIPLWPAEWYRERRIDLALGVRAGALDVQAHRVWLESGATHPYDRLLIATGADPARLMVPGVELPHVHYLRTLAQSRAIVAETAAARRAVVIGAGFIGLEVAAALCTRGLEVHVVAPDARPLEKVMGPALADFIRALHEAKGVVFHLQDTVTAIDPRQVTLQSGAIIPADLVVAGIGVRPAVALAEAAGIAVDRGILVDQHLETSVPGIFAAGDLARWPDPSSGERSRVEHWVVAQRQGQTAARNLLGAAERFDAVPFFWSQHYDVTIAYVGHAERWDAIELDGRPVDRDCLARFTLGGKTLAVATVFRDRASLEAEAAMERERAE